MSQPPPPEQPGAPGWPSGEPQQPPAPYWPPPQPPQQPGAWPPPQQPGAWQPAQPGAWQPAQPGAWQPPQQPSGWHPQNSEPVWGPPPAEGGWDYLGGSPEAPKRGGRGKLIASLVAVVALAGGGVATYVAVSNSNSHHGAASPKAAVQAIVDDINKSDLVGVLDDLAPGERDAIATPLLNDIKELKRIRVLRPDADPTKVAAVKTSIKNLAFDADVTVNDHVQIIQLTGGTVSLNTDASKIPFTSGFVKTLFPSGAPTASRTSTVDIADAVRSNNGKPIRIATEKVGGRWYPSIFYTIADYAAVGSGAVGPTTADYVPAKGAASPVDAVKQLVNALVSGDIARAIELLSPDEMAAVHDYAGLIVKSAGSSYPAANVHIDDLQLTVKPTTGGAQLVTLNSVTVTTGTGDKIVVTVNGDCVDMTLPGQAPQHLCTSQIAAQLASQLERLGGQPLTPAQKQALTDLFGGETQGGIVTTQSGGQWYVNPVRTILDQSTGLLTGLKGNDVLELIGVFRTLSGH
ncbi:MAG: proline-rich proteoglycan 2 [Pseudonocardiales bacterium]|nr:proline-rich proteoglycan 2 [Pseudonocardiales bacterium]